MTKTTLSSLSLFLLLIAEPSIGSGGENAPLDDSLRALQRALPRTAVDCTERRTRRLAAAAADTQRWAAQLTWNDRQPDAGRLTATVSKLGDAKKRVDRGLDQALTVRIQLAELAAGPHRRQVLRHYLRMTATLVDLSGRMRYTLRDAIGMAAYEAAASIEKRHQLLDLLTEHRVSIGAAVMSVLLIDPPPESETQPAADATKAKVLRLIAAVGAVDLVPTVAQFVRDEQPSPALTVMAADVIGRLGLPQDPQPGQDLDLPLPTITAELLHRILASIDPAELSAASRLRRSELLSRLSRRMKHGVVGDSFRVGNFQVRPGDWILMRNPSPYNLFTDLSPGLFTHVGVVVAKRGDDGIRRFLVIDLPERGDRVPATNLETYLERTLHYFFVRHDDPAVGKRMAEVGVALIGNPTQFDLTFQTDRVLALKGKPLEGRTINTYCAGLLLVCAQETTSPRTAFFPITEFPAGGNTTRNLDKLGLSIGKDFVSPTGAIFSPHLSIVGRREPMYDPGGAIKEAIYDHFADSMQSKTLTPSPDAYQRLRQKVAEVSKTNPWLAKALAEASGVSEKMDLATAAKAAAIVETLDEIADGAMNQFFDAREAIQAGPLRQLRSEGYRPNEIQQVRQYRRRHAAMYRRWVDEELFPNNLRIELVKFYVDRGKAQLDERFFGR